MGLKNYFPLLVKGPLNSRELLGLQNKFPAPVIVLIGFICLFYSFLVQTTIVPVLKKSCCSFTASSPKTNKQLNKTNQNSLKPSLSPIPPSITFSFTILPLLSATIIFSPPEISASAAA